MTSTINFYRAEDSFGFFSNFSAHPIQIDGEIYATTEHYFQAQKFIGTEHVKQIQQAKTPNKAATMGRSRKRPLRIDWEFVKDDVMRVALEAKFKQHPELTQELIATGDSRLVEHTVNDRYWGDGGDGSGKNKLGLLLMELREKLI